MEATNIPLRDGQFKYLRPSFQSAFTDDFTGPPAQNPDSFAALHNVIVGINNQISRRWGTTLFSNPTIRARRIFEAHFTNGRNRLILTASNGTGIEGENNKVVAINENGSLETNGSILVPSENATHPHAAMSRGYAYFFDGIAADMKKWNSEDDVANPTFVTKSGIDPPPSDIFQAVTSAEGTGAIYLSGGRAYTIAYRNSDTGGVSDITSFSGRLGITTDPTDSATGVTIELVSIPVSSDPQVDEVVIMATADGGAEDTLYEVAIIANGTTSYLDNKSEQELVDSQVWAELNDFGEETGVIGNTSIRTIAPTATLACFHRGRCYVLQGHFLFWSKSLEELTTSTGNVTGRWEECFPIENQLSLSSTGAEEGTAILSDDVNLYVGTNRSIYFLSGDNPGFTPLRALFHEVGVINQSVWQIVWHEGHQVGCIWLTPDKRLIFSDFNTYKDIGTPIQTFLNTMSVNTFSNACAMFVADGAQEFYFFSPGTPSLINWVYNVRTQAWMKWFSFYSTDAILAMGYMYDITNRRPLPMFSVNYPQIYRWNSATVYDHSDDFPKLPLPTILTNWLDFGDPAQTKILNDIELITGASEMTIDIEGALSEATFNLPDSIAVGEALVESPFGTLKAYLSSLPMRHRFYRFGFGGLSTSTASNFLSYLSIIYTPIHYS